MTTNEVKQHVKLDISELLFRLNYRLKDLRTLKQLLYGSSINNQAKEEYANETWICTCRRDNIHTN